MADEWNDLGPLEARLEEKISKLRNDLLFNEIIPLREQVERLTKIIIHHRKTLIELKVQRSTRLHHGECANTTDGGGIVAAKQHRDSVLVQVDLLLKIPLVVLEESCEFQSVTRYSGTRFLPLRRIVIPMRPLHADEYRLGLPSVSDLIRTLYDNPTLGHLHG